MTWIKFTIWLCGCYTAYYLLLIVWDTMKKSGTAASDEEHELTFIEHSEPVKTIPEPTGALIEDPLVFSGGVSLKQLFNLAREEAIEYVRPVGF